MKSEVVLNCEFNACHLFHYLQTKNAPEFKLAPHRYHHLLQFLIFLLEESEMPLCIKLLRSDFSVKGVSKLITLRARDSVVSGSEGR